MPGISPTLEGFRATWHRPSLTFAEISWRWVVGATAWALFAFSLIEYLRTLPVSDRELLMLRTRHPALVANALAHIMHGTLDRVVAATLVASLTLAFLWIVAASMGRNATMRNLLDYFDDRKAALLPTSNLQIESSQVENLNGEDFAGGPDVNPRGGSLRSLFSLNFLRVALLLAAFLGFLGAAILARFVSTSAHPHPGLVFLLFLPIAAFIGFLAWVLNWFLSLAAVFAVRDRTDALQSLSSAVAFSRERVGAVFAVSIWFGLAHLVLLVIANTAISMPFGFAPIVPVRLLLVVVFIFSLVYFAIADWLYMGRLAGYVCIAEMPAALLTPAPLPPVPPSTPLIAQESLAMQTSIDRDELILSDADPVVDSGNRD